MEEIRTLDAVAGQVADVRVAVARIEAKLDAVITSNVEAEARYEKRHEDHEGRIRRLERMVWTAAGAAAAGGGALGALATQIFGLG